MKKKLLAILTALCAIVAVCAFSGCAEDNRDGVSGEIDQGYSICYAFTASSAVLAMSDSTSMKDYMDALASKGSLAFEGYNSDYGFFVTSVLGVGSVTVSSTDSFYAGYSWMVYTTLTTLDGVTYSDDSAIFTYNGIPMYLASYGVSGLPCVEGKSYALVYEYSEMSF